MSVTSPTAEEAIPSGPVDWTAWVKSDRKQIVTVQAQSWYEARLLVAKKLHLAPEHIEVKRA